MLVIGRKHLFPAPPPSSVVFKILAKDKQDINGRDLSLPDPEYFDVVISAFLEYSILLGLVGISCYYLTGYLQNKHQLNRYSGPFLAKFSRLWLGYATRFGSRYQIIHQLHQKHACPSSCCF
ncbi:hypothetical protein PGT21_012581 [Puccinia graminis f. sp. tritici]|uniref:Uncharacterized protein n=2 Tax=Puccinia graminis f. sp. tritici TaxID=56615 RepID=E3NXY9_PUCGT|nr:uncharacterized protein PGTG_20394 [Puccinia graminis f. sp. tritici CRL 75-36-700-3]EFP94438.1 hypothetical protein PGTG_20394 [Puccinia graminis f. sp. tritici CRL 75-36-700-3]KAA1110149.1 hypothetical protein PGT21_012581 [Puccinia graminis f. sp. tritici]